MYRTTRALWTSILVLLLSITPMTTTACRNSSDASAPENAAADSEESAAAFSVWVQRAEKVSLSMREWGELAPHL